MKNQSIFSRLDDIYSRKVAAAASLTSLDSITLKRLHQSETQRLGSYKLASVTFFFKVLGRFVSQSKCFGNGIFVYSTESMSDLDLGSQIE